jgi:hypothetical protein
VKCSSRQAGCGVEPGVSFTGWSVRIGGRLEIAAALLWVGLATNAVAAETPRVVSATRIGSAGHDIIEGVAIADEGSIYVAGSSAMPVGADFGGAGARTLGEAAAGSPYGCAFVARFNADGTHLLGFVQLAAGLGTFTTVEVNRHGVYVGGYATEALEPLLAGRGGLWERFPGERRSLPHYTPKEHTERSNPQPDKSLNGAPVVLRFSHDLARLEHGTFLEGRHTIWHVPRPLNESQWQPTAIALLSGGDLVVCHDGGPILRPDPGAPPGLEHFYRCPDHLSRLSADLAQRRWKTDVYSPAVGPERISRATGRPWPYPTMGNARSLRLRADRQDNLYLAGWAAARTTKEPWWSPYLRRYDADGRLLWSAYEHDPTSGADERLNGLVSDAAVRSVAVDDQGRVLVAGIGDGGNSVLRRDPRDYTRPAPKLRGSVHSFKGRVLFWGMVARLDPVSRELLGGDHLAAYDTGGYQATWPVDIAPLPGGRVLAVGRHTRGFRTSADAWHAAVGPGGFVRVYAADFAEAFTSSVPDTDFFTVACRGARCAIVGVARSERAPLENALFEQPFGGTDGYLMVMDCP